MNEREVSEAFACQVLGLDGVNDGPAPEGTMLWRLDQLERQYDAEGRSKEEFMEAAQVILSAEPHRP